MAKRAKKEDENRISRLFDEQRDSLSKILIPKVYEIMCDHNLGDFVKALLERRSQFLPVPDLAATLSSTIYRDPHLFYSF